MTPKNKAEGDEMQNRRRDVEWIRACLRAKAQMFFNSGMAPPDIMKQVRESAKYLAAHEDDIQDALFSVRPS